MIWAVVGLALAAIPEGLRPAPAPADAPEAFAKAFPKRPGLACATLLPEHALLCFRVWEEGKRRWVTEADLTTWGTTIEGLRVHVAAKAVEVLKTEPTPQAIVDMPAGYHELRDGDGWAVAPLLQAEALAQKLHGEGTRVALPRSTVFLAWKPGDAELDRVMAVAVREMYDQADDAVTPMVHVLEGGRFVPFAQAKPTGG
ncbi:MAG: hypothetical protein H6737_25055 [Alphaproteobacteria bacterium]|nr:hypothetical protein [Alphaproteobacteria bacterium]